MLMGSDPRALQSELQVDLSAAPPFTLSDLKNAIPSHLFKRKAGYSLAYLARDVAVVLGLAAAAQAVNSWCDQANVALYRPHRTRSLMHHHRFLCLFLLD